MITQPAPRFTPMVESVRQSARDVLRLEAVVRALQRTWRRGGVAPKLLLEAAELADWIGLEFSRRCARAALAAAAGGRMRAGDYRAAGRRLQAVIAIEIGDPVLLRIPSGQAGYFLTAPPFGAEADRAFPAARRHFADAAFAAAHGRNELAAEALMIGIEAAGKCVGAHLGVAAEENFLQGLAAHGTRDPKLAAVVSLARSLRTCLRHPLLHGEPAEITDRQLTAIWAQTDGLIRSLAEIAAGRNAAAAATVDSVEGRV